MFQMFEGSAVAWGAGWEMADGLCHLKPNPKWPRKSKMKEKESLRLSHRRLSHLPALVRGCVCWPRPWAQGSCTSSKEWLPKTSPEPHLEYFKATIAVCWGCLVGSGPGPPKRLEALLDKYYLEILLSRGVETQLRNVDQTCPGVPFCPAQLSTMASLCDLSLHPQPPWCRGLGQKQLWGQRTAFRSEQNCFGSAVTLTVIFSAGSWQQVKLKTSVKWNGYAKAVWWWFIHRRAGPGSKT